MSPSVIAFMEQDEVANVPRMRQDDRRRA